MRTTLVLGALLAIGGIAAAQDAAPPSPAAPAAPTPAAKAPEKPLTPEQAADAVLAAVKAKDAAALKALAAEDAPDPWLVADELVRRAEFDAADAFARAAPRKDIERLPEYVASRRGVPDDAARRKRIVDASAALGAGRLHDALEAIGTPESTPSADVSGARLSFDRGVVLQALRRLEESSSSFLVAGEAAERLGWLVTAARALSEAAHSAYDRRDVRGFKVASEQWLRVEEGRGSRAGAAAARSTLGLAHFLLGDIGRSLEAYERSLKELEELGDRTGAAKTLAGIGAVHHSLGNYERALEVWERARDESEALGDRVGAAGMLGNIGGAYLSLGRYTKALEAYERALREQEALGDRVEAAGILGNIGIVHGARGDQAKALEVFERALAEKEALGDRTGAAKTLGNIGVVQHAIGNYAKALEVLEQARAAQEAAGDRAGAAGKLGNMGAVHASLGDYPKALEVFEQVRRDLESLGDRAAAAGTLGNIGNAHASLGSYAKALDAYERAFDVQMALGIRVDAAGTLGNIGNVHSRLGDPARALDSYERAFEMQEALGTRAAAATTLGNIGSAHAALGSYERALEIYERVLHATEALGDRAGAARALMGIGVVHSLLGHSATALEIFERVLAACQALGDRAGAATTLGNIGAVHAARGEHAKALELDQRALEQMQALGDVVGSVTTLGSVAASQEALGEPAKALFAARQGALLLPLVVSGLGEEQGALAFDRFGAVFDVGVRVAAATDDVGQGWFFIDGGRAGSLLASFNARDALRSGLLPAALLSAEAEARAKAAGTVKAYRKSLDDGNREAIAARRTAMEASQATLASMIERIQREAKRAASILYPTTASLETIRAALAPEEALVLYALTDTKVIALIVTRKVARVTPLPSPAKDITAAADALLAALDGRTDMDALGRAVDALRDLVVTPLGLPPEAMRVLTSPDGALSYIPFALVLPDREIAYVPSGSTYELLLQEGTARGDGVLALGDPDYASRVDVRAADAYRRGAAGRLTRLPATADEARAVGGTVLLGRDATENGLREAVAKKPRWRSVHFACHGLIDIDRPAFSSLALTADGDDDGFLTVLEVFRSKIPTDLVVLSACETAKGKVIKGEGIMGLTRAFMFAGSPRVICSLWKVDDEATKALMVKFYEFWNPKDGKPGLPTAEALRKAQAFVRDDPAHPKWKHPYYWAAWVLWGLPS